MQKKKNGAKTKHTHTQNEGTRKFFYEKKTNNPLSLQNNVDYYEKVSNWMYCI
jgi:hypothetical protein